MSSSNLDRRSFIKSAALTISVVSAASSREIVAANSSKAEGIIDTNINLFNWPFRALKYRDTKTLVAKLKKHRVIQAWAGSFEALFAKDMDGMNARLAAECHDKARGFLIPFGSMNLAWPDWEEDVRRCHEIYKMPGIRIYPGYQPFDLDHPGMERLLKMTAERGLILQIVFGMEDPRVYHPIINVGPVTFRPLAKAMKSTPAAKVQLLHFPNSPQGAEFADFMALPNTFLETSRIEGNGAVGRMLGVVEGLPSLRAPLDRIAFGSHAPFFPIETAILKLIESPLDAQQIHSIMNANARRLLPRA
jgi:hypothetical protein